MQNLPEKDMEWHVIEAQLGESLQIGEQVKISLLRVEHGEQVRLGLDAPRSVVILRQEVYDRVYGNKQKDAVEGIKVKEHEVETAN
ncbi:carbon storage regulator CsrA [soil metagenome]